MTNKPKYRTKREYLQAQAAGGLVTLLGILGFVFIVNWVGTGSPVPLALQGGKHDSGHNRSNSGSIVTDLVHIFIKKK